MFLDKLVLEFVHVFALFKPFFSMKGNLCNFLSSSRYQIKRSQYQISSKWVLWLRPESVTDKTFVFIIWSHHCDFHDLPFDEIISHNRIKGIVVISVKESDRSMLYNASVYPYDVVGSAVSVHLQRTDMHYIICILLLKFPVLIAVVYDFLCLLYYNTMRRLFICHAINSDRIWLVFSFGISL